MFALGAVLPAPSSKIFNGKLNFQFAPEAGPEGLLAPTKFRCWCLEGLGGIGDPAQLVLESRTLR
jgi:hypothetical protein